MSICKIFYTLLYFVVEQWYCIKLRSLNYFTKLNFYSKRRDKSINYTYTKQQVKQYCRYIVSMWNNSSFLWMFSTAQNRLLSQLLSLVLSRATSKALDKMRDTSTHRKKDPPTQSNTKALHVRMTCRSFNIKLLCKYIGRWVNVRRFYVFEVNVWRIHFECVDV
jgi:hypothetical protein